MTIIESTPEAKDWLGKHGYDPEFGARPLRRLIQVEVEDKLSDAMLSERFSAGDTIVVYVEDDGIVLRKLENQDEEMEEPALPP